MNISFLNALASMVPFVTFGRLALRISVPLSWPASRARFARFHTARARRRNPSGRQTGRLSFLTLPFTPTLSHSSPFLPARKLGDTGPPALSPDVSVYTLV